MAKKKVKKENSGGDCYVVAGEFAMGKLFAPKQIDYVGTPYVVHAEVKGQGAIEGLRYGHAWVEDDEWVYDFSNGREITFPKVLYYLIGNIKTDNPKKYRRYTFEEARRKMVQTGNYGCWDIETEYKEGGQIDLNPDIRFAEGGKTKRNMKRIKRGGITYGKSHAEGGIPVKNQSTGDMLEVEGGEGIVNKRSMASDDKVTLNGREMTICEAVSQLNQMEGGVKFNCDDVEHRQFLEEMARGGELERGTRTEAEHIKVLNDLYANRLTPKEATKRIAKDHLKEDSHYYSKLAKMEGKMADGGTTADNPFAEFGLRKDFKGDAFEKLESMERVNTNYCELNMTNCSSTKGIDRKDMPQIYEEHIDEYIDFLDENGIGHEMEWGVEVGKLKPTQANISVPRIKKILTRLINGYYTDT